MKKVITIILSLVFILVTCGQKENNKELTIGTSPGPYSELFIKHIKPQLEKEGFKVKTKDFTDLQQADVALNEGQIDVNVDQHKAYMDTFNKEKEGKLVAVQKIPTVPAQIFSKKHKNLNVKQGAEIAIPNDPSNAARAYRLLEKAGWIKLEAKKDDIKISDKNIVSNPHQLNIKQMDSANIPRILDEVDYAVIPGSIVHASKVDTKLALLKEDLVDQLYLQVVVNQKNEHKPWVKAIKKAYHSKVFKESLDKENTDQKWIVPKD